MFSAALTLSLFVFGSALIARGAQGKFLSRFPLFYSYIAFVVATGAVATAVYLWMPGHYPLAWWLRFLITLLAEFAVLVEISDHIFNPYPAVRHLGRLVIACICVSLLLLYVLPSFLEPRPSGQAILDLGKRASLIKALIIISLVAVGRYFRLPISRNVYGLIIGFLIYLTTNVANFALAERFGQALYGQTFSTVLRVSFALCLVVWTIALWRYQPAFPAARQPAGDRDATSEALSCQLGRLNAALSRRFRQ